MAYLYIVRCEDGSLYTGIAADIAHRMRVHLGGGREAAKYTRAHPVKELAALWRVADLRVAARLEYFVKRLSRKQKLILVEDPSLLGRDARFAPSESAVCEPLCEVTLADCLAGKIS